MADNKDFSNKDKNTIDEQKKSEIAKREEAVLEFWNINNIFKKTEEKTAPKGEYVFYDGPPFATGLPHYGHILAGTIKDAIPRYQTMRGYTVKRRWGWDCHGLPLENEIEKELGLKTKRDIEEIGIGKFNEAARSAVLRYADDWKKIVPRLGRFIDMDRDYRTMDTSYTESVWWVFKTLHDKKLIYKSFKSMHLCPRCGTTLSNFEVNLGYKDITDLAVYIKLEFKDEPGTYLLIWTTTPWTLPGNMAAAVHKDIVYVKVKTGDSMLIVAKDRLSVIDGEYSIIEEFKGEKLVGKSYIPPFDYFKEVDIEGKEKAWKIYHADYVSVEDGTGAVHLAPAFGEEDLVLAQQNGIPIIHHIDTGGVFTKEVIDFAGLQAKSKENSQETDIEIIKHLAHDDKKPLYKKEKITHSYPHCWRCDTPLLNYASSSWFVKVKNFKDKLVSENKKVGWVPKEVGGNRFGKWLEGARDWSISRSRYWGAPLPVWENKSKKDSEYLMLGSVNELKKHIKKSGNTYVMIRHGEAESNLNNFVSSSIEAPNHLTPKGKEQILGAISNLKKYSFDVVFSSPLVRTKETTEIIKEGIGISEDKIFTENRIIETSFGVFDGRSREEYWSFFSSAEERFTKTPENGENVFDVKQRVAEFIYEIESKYQNKQILIVTHEDVIWMLSSIIQGADIDGCLKLKSSNDDFFKNAEVRELPFVPLPHNKNYELDLHRPYIDNVEVVDKDGNLLERVPDVFDCWFESGSMPYGQQHYPFENTDTFQPKSGLFSKSIGYPADFIAEGMDQTRGWFYSLIVLGVGLFGKSPYKHVIVNGLVLDENGQKMSKRLKNYPDPSEIMDKYGADALRYYLLSSPIVRGEDLNFSESGVDEVMKKLILRLSNVLSFYTLYVDKNEKSEKVESNNVLDRWILARTHELTKEVTDSMNNYELDRATRPINLFIDDLSTWYIRRSRDRFKSEDKDDKVHALQTTSIVLHELSKIMAPFMPFYAETLYQSVKCKNDPESVHLCDWPEVGKIDKKILNDMKQTRNIVSSGLEVRSSIGIKVRQPLRSTTVADYDFDNEDQYTTLIKDELNVKEVVYSGKEGSVKFDTKITEELRREGLTRDIIRQIQQFRKNNNLTPQETIKIAIYTSEDIKSVIEEHQGEIKRIALLKEIIFEPVQGEGVVVDGKEIVFALK